MKPRSTVLILGGTSEAYDLAEKLVLEVGEQGFSDSDFAPGLDPKTQASEG